MYPWQLGVATKAARVQPFDTAGRPSALQLETVLAEGVTQIDLRTRGEGGASRAFPHGMPETIRRPSDGWIQWR